MKHTDIYSYIASQEAAFKLPITITQNWSWIMPDHIETAVLYKNSVFTTGKSDNKPFKNIIRPILNLRYRAEGFDVKDILLYIESAAKSFKSFLIKKFHERWARENDIDAFIDELVETEIDFGGVLVKKTKDAKPDVVPWQRVAFCDRTDVMSGPIAERHYYSSEELRLQAEKGWENVEEVIVLAQTSKAPDKNKAVYNDTPNKYVEVYEIHGIFPRHWLYDYDKDGNYAGNYYDPYSNDNEDVRQVHICTFYYGQDEKKHGITLFKGLESESPYKFFAIDKVFGRALGIGGVEELEDPQVWVNYGQIRLKQLLDSGSKTLYKTTDPAFANRNKTDSLDNGEILVVEEGRDIAQLDTTPRSTGLFDRFIQDWETQARQMGAANESILGESPTAGTPFKLQELITAESHSLHEYRKGKLAKFVEEIYRDWILPHFVREITNGTQFLAEFDLDEIQAIADGLANAEAQRIIKESIFSGVLLDNRIIEDFKAKVREQFLQSGNRKFIEILRGELKDVPVTLEINIVGKQKDLAGKTDKLVNVLRFMISTYNPQTGQFMIFQDPRMSKLFNQVLEISGLPPMNMALPQPTTPQPAPSTTATKPLTALAERPTVTETMAKP